ncbi:M23 family metallopeptidase [Alteromonas gracilis]
MSIQTLKGRRRWYAAASALLLTAGLAAPALADDLKDRQRDTQRDLRGAKSDLQESSRAAYAAKQRLDRARTQLSSAQQRLAATRGQLAAAQVLDERMQAELQTAEADLNRAREELRIRRQQVADQRDDIGRLAADAYQANDPDFMRLLVLFNTQTPAETTTQLETVDALAGKQERILDRLKALRAQMVAQEAKVEETRDVVKVRRQQAAENLETRERLEAEAAEARAAVGRLVSERATASQAADSVRASDKAQLDSLTAENQRISALLRERAAQAARERARQAERERNRGGGGGGGGGGNSGGGSSNSGPLTRPVPGYVTSPFGYRVHPIYGYYGLHDGTDFHAPCGTPLRASGNGTVVSTYYHSAWGNRVIVDLGNVRGRNIAVIYNHLSGDRVSSGQRVSRGEIVGWSGTTGWSTACHLHFTVMADGSPVDPMNWF